MAGAKKRTARISNTRLPEKFYQRDTITVAKDLLGKRLVRVYRGKIYAGIIVETEAYLGVDDPACHTWKNRRTVRNKSMYLPGGHAYVYLIYGMHHCFNVVVKRKGEPEAVLVRAVEPIGEVNGATNGPGRLCKALRITKALDGQTLSGEKIFLEESGLSVPVDEIVATTRVGVEYAGEAALWPLRFYWRKSKHVSKREKKPVNEPGNV